MSVPMVRSHLIPINVTEEGLVKRVRGVAYCTKISPTIVARVIDSCRGVLNNILPDVYIHTDHYKGKEGGDSPGYSLSLVAETTTGSLISVERTADTKRENVQGRGELPEDLGKLRQISICYSYENNCNFQYYNFHVQVKTVRLCC